jgi:hypothetical protein
MARVSLGRVIVVFFVSAVMALAILFFFAMPVKLASAQQPQCFTVEAARAFTKSAGLGLVELDADQSARYVGSLMAQLRGAAVDDMESPPLIIIEASDLPDVWIAYFVLNGGFCRPGMNIPDALHQRALRAAHGEPI